MHDTPVRTWTYSEITRMAESEISANVAAAERADSHAEKQMLLSQAVGALYLWQQLMRYSGHSEQRTADDARLSALVETHL